MYGYGFGIRFGRPGDAPKVWHNGGSPGVGAWAEVDMNLALGYTSVVLTNVDYPRVVPAINFVLSTLGIP
jgi:hypothetical protein